MQYMPLLLFGLGLHILLLFFTARSWKKYYAEGVYNDDVRSDAIFYQRCTITLVILCPLWLCLLLGDLINTWISLAKVAGAVTIISSLVVFAFKSFLKLDFRKLLNGDAFYPSRVFLLFLFSFIAFFLATTLVSLYANFILEQTTL